MDLAINQMTVQVRLVHRDQGRASLRRRPTPSGLHLAGPFHNADPPIELHLLVPNDDVMKSNLVQAEVLQVITADKECGAFFLFRDVVRKSYASAPDSRATYHFRFAPQIRSQWRLKMFSRVFKYNLIVCSSLPHLERLSS
jgi:hypothetical protein